jgi:hypothetical protein
MIPLMAIVSVISLHWEQFLALFGAGTESLQTKLSWKSQPLPVLYILSIMTAIVLFELLPYVEELLRGLRANRGQLISPKARDADRRQRL